MEGQNSQYKVGYIPGKGKSAQLVWFPIEDKEVWPGYAPPCKIAIPLSNSKAVY